MSLLERVTTLVRANLNDLIDQAEDPAKLLKQVILDMENQLLQVKTQVAIAIADHHVLERKRQQYEERAADWARRRGMFTIAERLESSPRASRGERAG